MANTLQKIMHNGDEYLFPQHTAIQVTLLANGWSNNEQTVSATGVTATNTVIASPDPSSFADYTDSIIYCSAQGTDSLTFTCDTVPSNDIVVNVAILSAEIEVGPTPPTPTGGTGNIQGLTPLYSASFSGTTRGTRMSNDGTILLVGEEDGNRLTEYSLSTPFDVTSVTEVTAITGLTTCQSACFNDDGTILTVGCRISNQQTIKQYSCPTPYHLTGATETYSVAHGTTGLRQAFYVNNGNTLIVANDNITQYTTGSPYNPTNLTQVSQLSYSNAMGIAFNSDGTMYVVQTLGGDFEQYQATTPFNVSTSDTKIRTESGFGQMLGICYTDDFYKLVFCNTSNQVKVYDLPNS